MFLGSFVLFILCKCTPTFVNHITRKVVDIGSITIRFKKESKGSKLCNAVGENLLNGIKVSYLKFGREAGTKTIARFNRYQL